MRRLLVTVDAWERSCGKCQRVNARPRGARCAVFGARLEWDNDYDGWTRLDACLAAEHDAQGGKEAGR